MLADVLAGYLGSLKEREFDQPFRLLLRSLGYDDITFLHGSFEFGKDFIAKATRDGTRTQFSFQTKAGDVDMDKWRTSRAQIDEMRRNGIAHPAFDRSLPRRAVLATTGRLRGAAAPDAQEYQQFLHERGEPGFDVWDVDRITSLLHDTPEIGLAGVATPELLGLLSNIDLERISDNDIERYSRAWLSSSGRLWRAGLEAGVIANRLRRAERLDLACFTALCLLRAAIYREQSEPDATPAPAEVADAARGLFSFYAEDLWERCTAEDFEPVEFVKLDTEFAMFVTYPVRCSRLMEILGLFGWLLRGEGDNRWEDVARYVGQFIARHPGAAHPISNHYAISLVAPLTLVWDVAAEVVEASLRKVVMWACNYYEKPAIGLAGTWSTPHEETSYLLGSSLAHVEHQRRDECYIATVVLDLVSLFGLTKLYDDARNDFLAVDARPVAIETDDTPGQYLLAGQGTIQDVNVQYTDAWNQSAGWQTAPHHRRDIASHYLERNGRQWDQLAVMSVVRDRHWPAFLARIIRGRGTDPASS
jgi:hypothetical protein